MKRNRELMERFYPESRFGGFSDVDGTIPFYSRVNALLRARSVVLNIGCGRGAFADDEIEFRKELRILQGKCKMVIGLDIDKAAESNQFIDDFRLIKDATEAWPIDNQSIDLCLCDYVLEHVGDPEFFFSEIRRVLKEKGVLCIRATNAWGYISMAARIIPEQFHTRILNMAQPGRQSLDVFPTYYRCNSIRKIKRILKENGFAFVVYGYDSEPAYFAFSRVLYRAAMFYHSLTPSSLKTIIYCFASKQ
jgi:SAM-dependent methyltransferase